MLKDTLYTITSLNHRQGVVEAVLRIHADNQIFEGHFPGQPVLPGACMLQMVKEILQTTLATPVRLKKADHMKFLNLIDPTKSNVVLLTLSYELREENDVNVIASLADGDVPFFKFKGVFIAV